MDFELAPIGLADDLPDFRVEGTVEQRKRHWLPVASPVVRDAYVGEYRFPVYKDQPACDQLFSSMVINPDGKIIHRTDGSAWDPQDFVAKMKR